ncbi:class I SAM-dependent methyltransferase [Rhizobium leguminosarum]|uniref:class I SAM-dependent methyltransferase n=1 Tax=Rhizobium leguminosarum TaxID=384 RepID=UPI001F2E6DB9|nr:class I SAM-dependent methyltransferase [Rhizobium leguminosarum]UIJ83172.1 class I SAM-dependent methyltransferase [Rhizobium leguminosarum]
MVEHGPEAFFLELDGLYSTYRPLGADVTRREVDFLDRILRRSGNRGSLIDVCCGYGRHANEFARRGWQVHGVDISPGSIQQATEVAREESLSAAFSVQDCRTFEVREKADAALVLGTSFGICGDRDGDDACVAAMTRAVNEQGVICFEMFNPGFEALRLASPEGLYRERRTTNGVAHHFESLTPDRSAKEYNVEYRVGEKVFKLNMNMPLYSSDSMDDMLYRHGFKRVLLFGNLNGDQYDQYNSERLILVYQRC